MNAPLLPELIALERIIEQGASHLQVRMLRSIAAPPGPDLPLYAICMGSDAPDAPAVGFFGGVHGLERIGAQVVIAYLQNVVNRLRWDGLLHRQLEEVRLVFMPIVNPGGMRWSTRANPHGVDLMRNAPVAADDRVPFLIGGQRISPRLPWFCGQAGAPMEAESQALCEVVETELLSRQFSLALDCHSGFGLTDRLWFPFAHTREPIKHLGELHALQEVFMQAYSNHRYLIEPQSLNYLAHGDLWDHLYMRACEEPGRIFLPLTLEMGSWLWIKKNPLQLFSRSGMFNPLIDHRQQRVLRQHLALLDFLPRAACGYREWVPGASAQEARRAAALAAWY
nr:MULTISPECIES: M14 family zinc carboxypeptidase [unclassified Acidovorax]